MHWKPWMTALAGIALGAGLVALLPEHALFSYRDTVAEQEAAATGERYACPMMDFISTKPGDCPVCGMKMHKITAGDFTREQQRRMGVQLSRVTEGPAVVTVRAYGAADYDHRFTHVVIPRVAGRIVKRYDATYGCCEEVAAGEPIIDLYSPELITAQGELAAAVQLGNTGLARALRARFERWNLAELAGHIEGGGEIRDIVTIRSPFGGQVLLRDFEKVNEALEVGREVAPDTQLLRLVDPERLALVVHVPETRARFLAEGQPVEIESDDLGPLPQVRAVIGRLAQEIDPTIRSREVRIYVSEARDVLQPGSLISAKIRAAIGPDLRPADPLNADSWGQFALIPKTAVLSTGVRNVAWRVAERQADGRLRFAPVSLALGPRIEDDHGNDLYIVRAGVAPGDEIATQGAFLIDSQAQLAGTPSLLFPLGAVAPVGAHQH
jgi:membrane fusion protein, copper/silver efflux system